MKNALSWTLILMLGGVKCQPSRGQTSSTPSPPSFEDGQDLLLTPFIESNHTELARNKSRVKLFDNFSVEAYSGFITINTTTNSNLFFLLTVAENNESGSPLLLWTQGGPGQSALFGQFLQNGPVAYNYTVNFTKRDNTLQKNMSIIYLDLPVGAGFSFTQNNTGYPETLEEISHGVMEFLRQFMKLFPGYYCRDLYLAGESYGARYSVAIAHHLLTKPDKSNVPLILKGVIGGNGFLGPILDTANSSDFLYCMSMLNETGYQNFSAMFDYLKGLEKEGNASVVPYLLMKTIFAYPQGMPPTLFQKLTLYSDHVSPLYTTRPKNIMMCFLFLNNTPSIRREFHVAEDRIFEYFKMELLRSLNSDFMRDITNLTQRVLNGTSVLLYTGQLDALFPSVNQRKYYSSLEWKYSTNYHEAPRTLWRPPTWDEFMGHAGYVREAPGFTEAVLFGMSHYGAVEKQDEVYYLMMDFINKTANKVA